MAFCYSDTQHGRVDLNVNCPPPRLLSLDTWSLAGGFVVEGCRALEIEGIAIAGVDGSLALSLSFRVIAQLKGPLNVLLPVP